MIRYWAAALLAVALLAAPCAAADPQDLEPYCTSGQEPTTGECLPNPGGVYTNEAPGAGPLVPSGLDPASVPAI